MKKLFVLAGIIILASLSACNFTEDLYLNADGTGKISIHFDAAQLMEMAGDEMMKGEEKAIDSIISFSDFIEEHKDSIATLSAEEQAKFKRLEKFEMHMLMNPENKEMKFELYSNFKSVDDLGDLLSSMQDASSVQGGKKAPPSNPFDSNKEASDVKYSFSGNSFSRITTVLDEELLKQTLDSLGEVGAFFEDSKYTLKYHFQKKIKSVSTENAVLSDDHKSFQLTVGFLEYMENPKALDVKVELED